MNGDIENLIIEQLRAIRNDIANLKRDVHDEFADVKQRLNSLERSDAHDRMDIVRQQSRLD